MRFAANAILWTLLVVCLADVPAARGATVYLGSTPYELTTIDVPGASPTFVNDINNQGQVVGTFVQDTIGHGFVFDGNTFTTLDYPDAGATLGSAINDGGTIGGSYGSTQFRIGEHGFVFDGDSYIPHDVPGAILTEVDGINNHGGMVGSFTTPDGRHGFVFDGDTYVQIDILEASLTEATDINDNGTVVGRYYVGEPGAGTFTGFIYENGTFASVNPGFEVSASINGINNLGHLVGASSPHAVIGGPSRGFFMKGDESAEIYFPGALHTFATGINDDDVIVGWYLDQQFDAHGFIATPVPEPTGMALFSLAFLTVSCVVHRSGRRTRGVT